jgi:hypothetical protein
MRYDGRRITKPWMFFVVALAGGVIRRAPYPPARFGAGGAASCGSTPGWLQGLGG